MVAVISQVAVFSCLGDKELVFLLLTSAADAVSIELLTRSCRSFFWRAACWVFMGWSVGVIAASASVW